jgi:hypothetical protein
MQPKWFEKKDLQMNAIPGIHPLEETLSAATSRDRNPPARVVIAIFLGISD